MSAPSVETVEVVKRYPDGAVRRTVVDRVSLSIIRGEFAVVQGPSGSGKSTLLGLLGGMIAPTSGDVRLEGGSIVHLRDHHRTALRRRLVGFVFQELGLVPGMSVAENLALPLVPTGGATRDERLRLEALADRFGLTARLRAKASTLSGGERQRAAIVRALARSPRLLLLDEPTAHLDAESVERVLEHLGTLKAEGTTLVATTHDPRLASHPSVDRVLTMRDGRLSP